MLDLLSQDDKLPTKFIQDRKPSHCDESIFPILTCLVLDVTLVTAVYVHILFPLYSVVYSTHKTIVGAIVDDFRVRFRVLDTKVSKGVNKGNEPEPTIYPLPEKSTV